jgi:hypothetical protein
MLTKVAKKSVHLQDVLPPTTSVPLLGWDGFRWPVVLPEWAI